MIRYSDHGMSFRDDRPDAWWRRKLVAALAGTSPTTGGLRVLLPGEEVDIGLVGDSRLLPGLSQRRGVGESLRANEVRRFEQQNDFIRVARVAQEMLLGHAQLGELGDQGVITAL